MSLKNALRNTLIALLAVVTALPFLVSPAHAAPNDGAVRATAERYNNPQTFNSPQTFDSGIRIKIFNGTLDIKDGNLRFLDNKGKVLETYPLTYVAKDQRSYPIDADIKGNTAELTLSKDVARSTTTPASVLEAGKKPAQKVICGPQTRKQRDLEALNQMNSELGTAATIGGIVGVIVGAIIGIVFSGGPLALIAGPIGALVGAGGGVAGAAINGTFARYFKTINSPFKPKTCNI